MSGGGTIERIGATIRIVALDAAADTVLCQFIPKHYHEKVMDTLRTIYRNVP